MACGTSRDADVVGLRDQPIAQVVIIDYQRQGDGAGRRWTCGRDGLTTGKMTVCHCISSWTVNIGPLELPVHDHLSVQHDWELYDASKRKLDSLTLAQTSGV